MTAKNILVPIDFSQASEQALDYACRLAAKLDAKVHLLNALGAGLPELNMTLSDETFQALYDGHRETLEKYADGRRPVARFGEILVKDGDARDVILDMIEAHGIDLVVMGTHGRRGLTRMILGSVAEDVSRRSPCPVLLVRAKQGRP